MFLGYYGLRDQPFGVTPDPRYLYLSATHREALASMFYGIETGRGFLALIAPPGMGKTTLIFRLLERLRSSAQTAFLFQTQCGSREFFRYLLSDLGVEAGDQNMARMHESLNAVLLNNARMGRKFVLIIDEAQNLEDSVLETVRLLSDFETPKSKLMQIVLAGQPQLADKLASPSLMQLRQRISIVSHLQPLTRSETMVYIEYRLCVAGQTGDPLFTYDAIDLISSFSGGIPRNINNICFNALTLGYAKRQKRIDAAIVREVLADLDLDALSSQRIAPTQTGLESLSPFDASVPLDQSSYRALHDAIRAAWGNDGARQAEKDQFSPERAGNPISMQGGGDPHEADLLQNKPVRMSADLGQGQDRALAKELEVLLASIPPHDQQVASAIPNRDNPNEIHDETKESITAPVASQARGASPEQLQPDIGARRHDSNSALATATSPGGSVEPHPAADNGRPHKTTAPTPAAYRGQQSGNSSVSNSTVATTSRASARFWGWLHMRWLFPNGQERRGALRSGSVMILILALATMAFVASSRREQSVGAEGNPVTTSSNANATSQAATSRASDESQLSKPPIQLESTSDQTPARGPLDVTVQEGQTLSGLSLHYMGRFDVKLTEQIQSLNPEIKDPDLILVGQRVRLPRPARESEGAASSPATSATGGEPKQ